MSDTMEVRNEEIEEILKTLGRAIGGALPQGWGFSLFLLSHGEKGSTFYISNLTRDSMVGALKEFIAKQEKKV